MLSKKNFGEMKDRLGIDMQGIFLVGIIFLIIIFSLIFFVNAVELLTIFNKDSTLSVQNISSEWSVIQDTEPDFFPIILDKNKHKTTICIASLTATKTQDLLDLDFSKKDSDENELSNQPKIKSKKIQSKDTGLSQDYYGYCYTVTDKEEKLKFGSNSIMVEYQEISTVSYEYDNFNINATIEECDLNRENCGLAYPSVLIVDSSKLKFGAEKTGATTDTNFKYIFESTKPILTDREGYYLEGKTTYSGTPQTRTTEKVRIDASDVCSQRWDDYLCEVEGIDGNYTTTCYNKTAQCEYDTYEVIVGNGSYYDEMLEETVNYDIVHYYLEVLFELPLGANNTIFIDPSYTITEFQTSESIDTNITQENNFSHLEISDTAPYDSLVLYMPFDVENKSDGKMYDWTDNGNDGTINGNPVYNSSGKYGGAMEFDGVGDYVNCGNDASLNITGDITISAWVKSKENQIENAGVVSKNKDSSLSYSYIFRFDSGVTPEFFIKGLTPDRITFTRDVQNEVWSHIVGVYNGSDLIAYVDGVSAGTVSVSGSIITSNEPLVIGHQINTWFNGSIDEVMIFNTSLTQQQIQDIYNNQSKRFKTPGTQELKQFNITAGNNTVNVSSIFESNLGSNLSLRLGKWDVSLGYNDSIDGGSVGYTLTDGLVGYWHFDNRSGYENDTHVMDYSGMGNNGTANGNPVIGSDGVYDKAMEFDGVGDYVDVGDDSALSNQEQLSYGAWFKKQSTNPDYARIISRGKASNDRITMSLGGTGAGSTDGILINMGNGSNSYASKDSILSDNVWHHGFVVFDGSGSNNTERFRFYLDGSEVIGLSFSGTIPSTSSSVENAVYIGSNNINSEHFNGSIDEVMIFNRSLSANEIKQLYIKGRANWDYTEPQDLVSNGNNTFNISTNTTNILPEYNFEAGNGSEVSDSESGFYSPVLFSGMSFDFYDSAVGAPSDNAPVSILSQPIDNQNYTGGTLVTFEVNATDDIQLQNVTLYVWNEDNSLNHTNFTNWNGTSNTTTFTYTFTVDGLYTWNALVYDNASQSDWDVNRTLNISTPVPVDNEYPIFSNYLNITANNTEYAPGLDWIFNVTITHTNGTAGIDFNDINYTASNTSATIFNRTINDLGAGTFSYYWWAYGNGTSNNYNSSNIQSYTIAKNSSLVLTQTFTSPITYGTTTDFTGVGCPTQLTCSLNLTNAVFGVGTISANYSTAGNDNYTATSNISAIVINQAIPEGSLTGTSPITFGTAGDVEGTESNTGDSDVTYTLFRDDVEVSNPDTTTLGVGTYSYIYNATGGTNYTDNSSMDTFSLTVNQIASSVNLTLNGTQGNVSIVQGDSIDLNCSTISGDSGAFLTIYHNGTLLNNGTSPIGNTTTFNTAGLINITCNYENTQNYSTSSDVWWVNVTSAPDTTPPYFTTIPANASIDYLEGLDVDFDADDETSFGTYAVNDSRFIINSSGGLANDSMLGVGTYVMNITINDSSNNLNSTLYQVDVNQIVSSVNLTLNGTSVNISINQGDTIDLNCSIISGDSVGRLVLYNDGTLINNGTSAVGNTTTFSTNGLVNVTCVYEASVNYSRSSEVWYLNVTIPVATPQNEVYPTYALPSSSITITADLAATDALEAVNVTLNVPSGFQFPFSSYNQTQVIGNFSALQTQTARWFVFLPNNETTHTFNVTWRDTYNNIFQGDNKDIVVSYDSTNLTNTTNVNVIAFPELDAGGVLESEIQVRDIDGNLVNASSVKISLYDSNDNLVVDSVNFVSQLGTGRYFYNYTTPVTPTGQWLIYANVTREGNSFIDREYFRLTGGPFDVRGITITDSTAPNLGVSVILENMGDGVVDIVVDWNLTRTDTGALLDSGQDTVGVTGQQTHTITPETTYTGEVTVTFLGTWSLTEKAGAVETFTISSAPALDSEAGSSSPGGGVVGKVIYKSEDDELKEGMTRTLKDGEKIKFNIIQESIVYSHSLEIIDLQLDRVTMMIYSNPITIILYLYEEKKLDLDGDGYYDLYVKLEKIEKNRASIYLKSLYELVEAEQVVEEINETEVFDEVEEVPYEYLKQNNLYLLIGFGSLIFVLLLIMVIKGLRRERRINSLETRLKHLNELKIKEEISKESYHVEREELLQKINNILKNKYLIWVFSFIGLIILFAVVFKQNIIGNVIGIDLDLSIDREVFVGIILFLIFGILFYFFKGRKGRLDKCDKKEEVIGDKEYGGECEEMEKEVVVEDWDNEAEGKCEEMDKNIVVEEEDSEEDNNLIDKFFNNQSKTEPLTKLINKKVYTDSGYYFGKIKGIVLGENKIDSLKIKLNKKQRFKIKGVIVDYGNVKSVGQVVIIDAVVLDNISSLKN